LTASIRGLPKRVTADQHTPDTDLHSARLRHPFIAEGLSCAASFRISSFSVCRQDRSRRTSRRTLHQPKSYPHGHSWSARPKHGVYTNSLFRPKRYVCSASAFAWNVHIVTFQLRYDLNIQMSKNGSRPSQRALGPLGVDQTVSFFP